MQDSMHAGDQRAGPTKNHTFFFSPPSVPTEAHDRPGGVRSVLYVVRQEIALCLAGERTVDEDLVLGQWEVYRGLLPATLLIFAALDLLAKFAAGSDNPLGADERFCRFLRKYLAPSIAESERWYAVRRTLLASFGMYDPQTRHPIELEAICGDPENAASPVRLESRDGGEAFVVCVRHLYGAFVAAVARYAGDVEFDILDRKAFDWMFRRYGCIRVASSGAG